MRVRLVVMTACALLCTSCVLPARSFGAYEEKAATTAESVLSAVETTRLALKAALEDKALGAYTTIMFDEAEEAASGATSTLISIQPPDDRSRRLLDEIEPVLNDAVDAITALRVAARGGESDEFRMWLEPLAKASADLNEFVDSHR